MNRIGLVFAFVIALLVSAPAQADSTGCERALTVTSFSIDAAKLKRQAGFINLWWTSDEARAMPFEQKKARRIADIDEFYGDIASRREAAYAQASCLVVATKKCASSPGHRHSCPMVYDPPANMRFVPSTLKDIDDDFDERPHFLPGGAVAFTNKKTGAGSNTDGFQAIAEYRPDYVARQVKAEMDQVHAITDPLFDVGLNASSTG